ncbi:hypothetical protein J6TS2_16480 [Heyndrickxia sporothermodurans]|nr:hypothetical protein J6TS2_16480 [Heyndrickxia sporothermodurans]
MYKQLHIKYEKFHNKYVVQKRRPQEYFINRYYAHLVDPFFTKCAYDLKLSPNIVTIMAGLAGVLSGIAFICQYFILGAILLQLHHLLDGADGNLARLTNRMTVFGAKLDKLVDQIVRFTVFFSLALVCKDPLWVKLLLFFTIYFDLFIVHYYVLPYAKKHSLIRSKWKKWFLSKGIIPAFDIFLIYFLISVFALFGKIELVIYIIIIGKNIDWIYRVWEVEKTKIHLKKI